MRAFVSGGAGFVGAAVVRALLAAGAEVSCLVRPTSPRVNLDGLDVDLVVGDLGNVEAFGNALRGCQTLYHIAAFYSTRPEDAQVMFDINVGGTRNLLRAALDAGVERVVHTSTIGTIGRPADGRLPTEEDVFTTLGSASPYARSKIEAEKFALSLAGEGAPIVVVNPCAPVGAGDIKPSSTGVRILSYVQGRAPSFLAGGINFVSVEDVAAGHLLAAERGCVGQRYILGHAEGNLMRADFYQLMARVTGVRPPEQQGGLLARVKGIARQKLRPRPNSVPGAPKLRDYRPQALTADPSRAIRELGLPQTPLDVAVRQAVDWFRAHGYV